MIPKDLITQASLDITKYQGSKNVFGTISLKNNSPFKVIFATIVVTDLETNQSDYYRFRPLRHLIPSMTVGEIKGTIIAPKIADPYGGDFSTNYKWNFMSVYGYR